MANLLVSAVQPVLPILLQKSADLREHGISDMWGITDQHERLQNNLFQIHDVLANAEEEGNDKLAVKSWLANLQSALYDADDILDEFHYEVLRRDAVRCGHNIRNVSVFFSLENPALFRYKMSRKFNEVVERIDDLVTKMERFKFVQGSRRTVVHHSRTESFVIDTEVVGRLEEKEELVTLLTEVCPIENLMVLPIVGMGGIGKTTLAQQVYNDSRVKEYFNLQLWVNVSEEFIIVDVVKRIIRLVEMGSNLAFDNKELLQSHLCKILSAKRYLLVLDDVWNENVNKWEKLRPLLNCGDSGSTIIVTTRSSKVASIMGTVESYNLGCLGEEDSWNLFKKRAFDRGVRECQELVGIGRMIVQNCRGLPLAINTIGSLMSYKSEVREWLAILEESKIWEQRTVKDKVLPVLRLSYDHLSSYMKQCFAFCAVFPMNYVMEKEKLVQYWIANEFISSDGSGSLEMKGSDIFNELVSRSFFQVVKHEYHGRTTCKMHDLMHDLAQYVMSDQCLSMQDSSNIFNKQQWTRNVRHISLMKFTTDITDTIECFPTIRSLISSKKEDSVSYVHKVRFVKSNLLRVLDLSLPNMHIETIMLTPGKMLHLRYLCLSCLSMTEIPEEITTLYLLQTLRLFNCFDLSKLPDGMRYMVNLRHLNIEGCFQLRCMPPGLGELKCLETLTCYVVGTGAENRIGELKTLNLGGQLEVYNLREVRDAREAREVSMVSKQKLDRLAFCWGMPNKSNGSGIVVDDPFEVLDALKPCNKLKVLRIDGYNSDKFPVWMMDYQILENLVELYIIECRRCTNIPPLHRLPLLQILHIKCMDNWRHLCCGAECGEGAQITFPALKSLILKEMPNLDCWCEGDVGEKTSLIFPVLSHVSITDCPKLSAIPVTPLLQEITIEGNETLSNLATGITNVRSLTLESRGVWKNNADETLSFKLWESLRELTIKGFNNIIPPTNGRNVDVNATSLRKLNIISSNFWFSSIPSNSSLWIWKCFTFLEFLQVNDCDNLVYWPEKELSNLICLQEMNVYNCKYFLGSLLEPSSEVSTRQVLLPKLKNLEFLFCPNMVEVPQLPESLEELQIRGCRKLDCLPEWLGSLESLKELEIDSCERLSLFPLSIGGLIALERLRIDECINLSYLPEGMQGLEALKTLEIFKCPKIRILPEGLLQRLRSLDYLEIKGCPLLQRDFQKHGKYWHLISEIPNLKIEEGGRSSKIEDLTRLISSCKIACLSAQS